MPLLFLSKESLDKMKKDNVVHFYEYNKTAGPRSVNGYPIFTSCRSLTERDYTLLCAVEGRLRQAVQDALGG